MPYIGSSFKTFVGSDAITVTELADDSVDSAEIVDGAVDFAHIQNVAANSILGRNANSSGVLSEIALSNTQILIGDGTGFTPAALSGAATMTNAGVVSLAASQSDITTLAGLTTVGSVANALTMTFSDITLFHDANNADTSFSIGTSATEALKIEVLNGASNKTAEEVKFSTATASATDHHGKMVFNVDGTNIITINDDGVTLHTGAVTGNLTGNVTGTASIASTVTTVVDDTDDGTAYLAIVNAATGNQAVKTHGDALYDTQYGILYGLNEIRVDDASSNSAGDPGYNFNGDATSGYGRYDTGETFMSVAAREIFTMFYTSDFGRYMKFEQKSGGNHQTICFDTVIDDDHKVNGITIEGEVGTGGAGFMDLVYILHESGETPTGRFCKADASATGTMPAVGLNYTSTKSAGDTTRILIQGIARDDSWAWTPGGRLYVSETAGDLTQTAPSDDGDFIQVVGIALTADSIYFAPELTTIESSG